MKEYIIRYTVIQYDTEKKSKQLDEIKGHNVVKLSSIKDIEDKLISNLNTTKDKQFKIIIFCYITTEENTIEEIYNKELFVDYDSILDAYLSIYSTLKRIEMEEHLDV